MARQNSAAQYLSWQVHTKPVFDNLEPHKITLRSWLLYGLCSVIFSVMDMSNLSSPGSSCFGHVMKAVRVDIKQYGLELKMGIVAVLAGTLLSAVAVR